MLLPQAKCVALDQTSRVASSSVNRVASFSWGCDEEPLIVQQGILEASTFVLTESSGITLKTTEAAGLSEVQAP